MKEVIIINEYDILLIQIDTIKNSIKFLKNEISVAKQDKNDSIGWYDDKTDYNERIITLINIKIKFEKYLKKLKYTKKEIENNHIC